MSKINGFIFYRGPSALDGAPIIAIATGTAKGSRNVKTGGEVQTWILRDDMSPLVAADTGADASICGDCPHRGSVVDGKNVGRSCYVTLFQAPLNVWKSAHRGIYPTVIPKEGAAILSGLVLRLGSYGDPAAVPFDVWQGLLAEVSGHTGYTHAWRTAPELAAYCMASCDTPLDYVEAKAKGWRTFRVMPKGAPLFTKEIACPASKEMGAKTSCALCKACGGNTAKAKADVAIMAHGMAGKVNAFAARTLENA